MRCAVNATTERGPRVAGLPGGVRPAAECHYRLAADSAAAERRLGFCPPSLLARLAFLTAPPLTVHLSCLPRSFVADSVQFRNGNGMGAWQKGSIEMSGETNCSRQCVILGPLSNLETISRSPTHANPPRNRKHAHDRGAEGFFCTHFRLKWHISC